MKFNDGPTRHSLGHFGDDIFTGLMTQLTVSKHWRKTTVNTKTPQTK